MTSFLITRVIPLLTTALIAFPTMAADQHEKHEHADAKDVAAYHAVLSPLWHAPASPARIENACKQAPMLEKLALNIKNANAAVLVEANRLFKEKCQSSPQEAGALFGKLHDEFHHVSDHKH